MTPQFNLILYLIKFVKLEPAVAVKKVYAKEFTLLDRKGQDKISRRTELTLGISVDLVKRHRDC